MKTITIEIESLVPYAPGVTCKRALKIDPDELSGKFRADYVTHIIDRLDIEINRDVDREMEKRGIKLGPDGMRIKEEAVQ